MQKAIRNTSGKSTTAEKMDKRDEARNKLSSNPLTKEEAIDRDYQLNRMRQAKAEQARVSDNPQDSSEFNTRRDG